MTDSIKDFSNVNSRGYCDHKLIGTVMPLRPGPPRGFQTDYLLPLALPTWYYVVHYKYLLRLQTKSCSRKTIPWFL